LGPQLRLWYAIWEFIAFPEEGRRECGSLRQNSLSILMNNMNTCTTLRQSLWSMFSVEIGLSESYANEILLRAFKDEPSFRSELKSALDNPDICWKELLCDDEFEIYPADSEEEARDWVNTNLRVPLRIAGLI
jgi:hypothetical protein